ncbi:MAG: hypothetical protein ACYC6N_15005, partial [Pirellulaceae bacterium]
MSSAAPPRKKSAGTVILLILLLGFLLLLGLIVAGVVGFAIARARVHQAQARAMSQHEIALRHRRFDESRQRLPPDHRVKSPLVSAAEAEIEPMAMDPSIAVAGQAPAKEPIRVAQREITVQLDETGKISVDGTACE